MGNDGCEDVTLRNEKKQFRSKWQERKGGNGRKEKKKKKKQQQTILWGWDIQ